MREKEAAVCDRDNGSGKDESITVRNDYPWAPCPLFWNGRRIQLENGSGGTITINLWYLSPLHFSSHRANSWHSLFQVMSERNVSIAKSIANDIIIRDPTAKVGYLHLQNSIDESFH
jgi:hypothetical protein